MTDLTTFSRWRARMGIKFVSQGAIELGISRNLAAGLDRSDDRLKRYHRLAMAALAQGLPEWGSPSASL